MIPFSPRNTVYLAFSGCELSEISRELKTLANTYGRRYDIIIVAYKAYEGTFHSVAQPGHRCVCGDTENINEIPRYIGITVFPEVNIISPHRASLERSEI